MRVERIIGTARENIIGKKSSIIGQCLVGGLRLVKKSVVFSDGCEIGSVCAEIQCVLEDNSKLLVHSVSH